MIVYDPLFETLKEKNMSTYKLIKDHKISSATINRIKHNKPLSTRTVNDICNILNCSVDKVMYFTPDPPEPAKETNNK